ncbi:hypothetical protein ACPOL_0608 [Acidisarcina polymorpha]|uniref:Uncharacterized protein n=1 Tax=Acidisarcina polymorpha TaxID=2211140 RepID=A0A2Z5FT14_9BACT|nr:hypothetical protein ACPOL_0608 [Acidisarcina polymorpha]
MKRIVEDKTNSEIRFDITLMSSPKLARLQSQQSGNLPVRGP